MMLINNPVSYICGLDFTDFTKNNYTTNLSLQIHVTKLEACSVKSHFPFDFHFRWGYSQLEVCPKSQKDNPG